MLIRAIFAFVALPGVVAFVAPLLLARGDRSAAGFGALGLPLLALGTFLLLWCVRDFYVAGKGTLAPWSPPRELVVVGLYRWSRNPMYVAVVLIVCGWALCFRSPALFVYAAVLVVAFHLRVVLFEEPWLERTHGDAYRRYREHTPRWLGYKVSRPP